MALTGGGWDAGGPMAPLPPYSIYNPAQPHPPRAYVDPYKIGHDTYCVAYDEYGRAKPCTLTPITPRPMRPEDV